MDSIPFGIASKVKMGNEADNTDVMTLDTLKITHYTYMYAAALGKPIVTKQIVTSIYSTFSGELFSN